MNALERAISAYEGTLRELAETCALHPGSPGALLRAAQSNGRAFERLLDARARASCAERATCARSMARCAELQAILRAEAEGHLARAGASLARTRALREKIAELSPERAGALDRCG